MPDDPAAVRQHYATERNLAGRQQLFAYAAPASTPGIESYFVWPDDAVVLDVGCGNGLWTAHAAARTARGLTVGVDLSAGIIASARQRAETALYCQADASSLPFRESIADVILAFWMLYHVPDKSRALREIKRLLKPGGWFMAATNANRGLGILDDIFTEAASVTLGRPVDSWFPSLDFSLENGQEVLGPFFGNYRHAHRRGAVLSPGG